MPSADHWSYDYETDREEAKGTRHWSAPSSPLVAIATQETAFIDLRRPANDSRQRPRLLDGIAVYPREAKVLQSFAEEEAAKILILMDFVRCPPKLVPARIGKLIGWFYDHLARLIYAEAMRWKPMHLAQLRDYVDRQRRGHFLEGHAGEYILPNWTIYERESRLYADLEAYQDGSLGWSAPRGQYQNDFIHTVYVPPALEVAEAMREFGLFTRKGLEAISEIWGSLEYREKENHLDGQQLTERLLMQVHDEGLITPSASKAHAAALYNDWQIPMYNLEFDLIPVTLAELEAAQEREYWSLVGG